MSSSSIPSLLIIVSVALILLDPLTKDIAFKSLTINKVRYNICDSPGHLQYTKNMAAAASICDVAILLVNAKKGITVQTRRHLYLLSLLYVP